MDGVDLIRAFTAQATRNGDTPASDTGLGVVKQGVEGPGSFAERATQAFLEADRLQKSADHETSELAAGRGSTVETMVALSKADLSLRLVVALRNRALQAYEELMRMQV